MTGRTARLGKARHGKARPGKARHGKARQGRRGEARRGKARQGQAWLGKAGAARQGFLTKGEADLIYQFRNGSRIHGVNAKDAGETLESIREKHGTLKPEMVVQTAKSSRSKIHSAFEWNDEAAGREHRLWQARQLIRSVVVVMGDGADSEPAFVHIKSAEGRYYQATRVAAENVDEWKLVMDSAVRSLASAADNLERLEVVANRVRHVNRLDISAIRNKIDGAYSHLTSIQT